MLRAPRGQAGGGQQLLDPAREGKKERERECVCVCVSMAQTRARPGAVEENTGGIEGALFVLEYGTARCRQAA